MTDILYTLAQAPMRKTPGGELITKIAPSQLVQYDGEWAEVDWDIYVGVCWQKVTWRDYTGWIYSGYLETYKPLYPDNAVVIDTPTPNPYDSPQYILYEGKVKYNMCGELCCAFILGKPLDDVLGEWIIKKPNIVQRIFRGSLDRGTGAGDLESILSLYNYTTQADKLQPGNEKKFVLQRLDVGLMDLIIGRPIINPYAFDRLLVYNQAIVGVRISPVGRLQRTGVSHWVVVTDMLSYGINDGWVELYNPFINQQECYSWSEFSAAMGAPAGLWVPTNSNILTEMD